MLILDSKDASSFLNLFYLTIVITKLRGSTTTTFLVFLILNYNAFPTCNNVINSSIKIHFSQHCSLSLLLQ